MNSIFLKPTTACIGAYLAMAVFILVSDTVPAAETITLRQGRVKATLMGLFYADASESKDKSSVIGSVAPSSATASVERAGVVEFVHSLVYEGGFYPPAIYGLLGISSQGTARASRLVRQIDQRTGQNSSAWDVAGRVGTSASAPMAMAPAAGSAFLPTPGTMAYLPALAIVYISSMKDGEEAAAHLALLKDDDLRAEDTARSGVRLLMEALKADKPDKDAWIRNAAATSRDEEVERALRSLRVKDWRYLRDEECALGRLERAVFIWYKSDSFAQAMATGKEKLRARESRAYLAALAAATYGMEALPESIAGMANLDRTFNELATNLFDLATGEAVLPVAESQANPY